MQYVLPTLINKVWDTQVTHIFLTILDQPMHIDFQTTSTDRAHVHFRHT